MTRVENAEGETIIWPSISGGVWVYYSHLFRLDYYSPQQVAPAATHFFECGHGELAEAILEAVNKNIH